jgi:DNA-binding response OmpR family regulator
MARVLTIDDDRIIRTLLSVQLTERGHEVIEAETGELGLEIARTKQPDVVLLDLGLPGMHGSVVLDALKRDPLTTTMPVIVLSAWGEGHVLNVALARGAAGVLRKPFDAGDLFALIEAALRGATSVPNC